MCGKEEIIPEVDLILVKTIGAKELALELSRHLTKLTLSFKHQFKSTLLQMRVNRRRKKILKVRVYFNQF